MKRALLSGYLVLALNAGAQILTKEDSLNAGLVRSANATVLSGYGEASVKYDSYLQTAHANVDRAVVFLGHRFNKNILLFTETELEDTKVNGSGGEISLEQAFVKFNLNKDMYIAGGLFIPRIGIINENHLPTTYNSVSRPQLETQLIPATWREIGIGFYYAVPRIPGLNLSAGIMNGLNSQGFGSGQGIVEGKFEGRNATASNIAVNAAVLFYYRHFRFQVSGYYGGTAGLTRQVADSLKLNSGPFGTPAGVFEANAQYLTRGFYCKAIACVVTIPEAQYINQAYANNTPQQMHGFYVEAGYNLLKGTRFETKKLNLFARYENFDLNAEVPENGIRNDAWQKSYIASGLAFQPVTGVLVKADVEMQMTGKYNQALILNPNPWAPQYRTQQTLINIGVAYSF